MRFFSINRIVTLALFSIIYFAVSSIIISNNKGYVDFTNKELLGLEYHRELMNVLIDNSKAASADEYFKNNKSDWFDFSSWDSINKNNNRANDDLENLMLDIADKSNLILDPELPSYYMMNILVNIIPNFEYTGKNKKNLERSIQIISQNKSLKDKLEKFTFSKETALNDYLAVYNLLKKHLEDRVAKQKLVLSYSIILVFFAYIVIVCLVVFVIKNQIEASEVKAAKEKQNLIDKLEKTNVELEQFAYVASHDLKEPVRMVANFATLLERNCETKLSADDKYYTSVICQSAKRIETMIVDLLSYARIDDEQGSSEDFCDANKALQAVLENLKTLIDEKGAIIKSENLPRVKISSVRLIRLMQNLITNAIKYGKENEVPKINISANIKGDFCVFAIKDNGVGIDKKYLIKIFEPFKRLHNKSHSAGTGIGLAICKKIVEKQHGKIWAESETGKGSTFFFSIPLVEK